MNLVVNVQQKIIQIVLHVRLVSTLMECQLVMKYALKDSSETMRRTHVMIVQLHALFVIPSKRARNVMTLMNWTMN
jgi:hypothetical protein